MNGQSIEQKIQAKGLTAPRVTPADIEANIAGEVYFTAADGVGGTWNNVPPSTQQKTLALSLLTLCVLTLRNGFTVTGESACASPENFDAELGRKIARENAINKVWPLMGYALKDRLHAQAKPAPGAAHPGYSVMAPHQQRVVDEKAELDDRAAKLRVFLDTPIFAGLDVSEQHRLGRQLHVMQEYALTLGERIAAFANSAS